MSQYITRPGGHDATYAAPSTATGVDLRLYVLPTSHAALAATLDRYVNAVAPAGTTFVPLGSTVVACFAALGKVAASDPTLGFMREIDCAFLIPTVRFDAILPTAIVFFAPYLFVDIPQAAASGREIHGYRKEVGTSFSAKNVYDALWVPNAADLTHIEAWAVPAPSTQLQRTKLVDVASPAGPPPPLNWPDSSAALLDFIAALMDDVTALSGTIGGLLGNLPMLAEAALQPLITTIFEQLLGVNSLTLPVLFLRQFRDPTHNQQADVQELLVAKMSIPVNQLSGAKLPGAYSLTFHDTVSHPFSSELGTTSGVATPATLTVHTSCGFTLQEATRL
jgi:hypothetical protein